MLLQPRQRIRFAWMAAARMMMRLGDGGAAAACGAVVLVLVVRVYGGLMAVTFHALAVRGLCTSFAERCCCCWRCWWCCCCCCCPAVVAATCNIRLAAVVAAAAASAQRMDVLMLVSVPHETGAKAFDFGWRWCRCCCRCCCYWRWCFCPGSGLLVAGDLGKRRHLCQLLGQPLIASDYILQDLIAIAGNSIYSCGSSDINSRISWIIGQFQIRRQSELVCAFFWCCRSWYCCWGQGLACCCWHHKIANWF